MINKFLKTVYAVAIVGLLFVQVASGMPTEDGTLPSGSPHLSADGKTLYNGIPPVIYVADPNPSHPPLRIKAAFDLPTLPPESATATFSITYVPNTDTDRWGNTCTTFPPEAQTALDAAASIWGNIVLSPVPITIEACWASLTGSTLGRSGGGMLHSDFEGAPLVNTFYVGSLANALAGEDLAPSNADMHITFNFNFPWYTGTDGNTPGDQVDLMSVALHEIAHGLGFAGSMFYSGGQGSWGSGYNIPFIYDIFTRDGSGNQLINTGIYANPSTALGSALTSGNIYFQGSNAMAANGGQRVKIYAPSSWIPGSSYSHLDYDTFNNTPNQLMVWAISYGEFIHDPGPVTIGLLTDLGWVTPNSACTYSVGDVFVNPCDGKSPCYSSIQEAINNASTCIAINTTGDTNEDVIVDKKVILQGGWNSAFTAIESNTTIRSLNITTGKLTVGNIILSP